MAIIDSLKENNRIRALLPWVILLLVLTVSLWSRGQYMWNLAIHWDEGHWLMFAILANAGYPAYSVTFVGIPPLALLLIQLGAKLFGTSLALRYPMMLVTLVGIGAIFWFFRPKKDLFGLTAGTFAALFLSFAPLHFQESVSIMGEAPAVAMALLSLLLAQQFYYNKKLVWLLLSGIVFGLSLAIKIFVIFLPILIGFVILLSITSRDKSIVAIARQLAASGLAWSIGAVMPLVIFVLIYDPGTMYQQVIAFRFALREVTLARGLTPLDNVVTVMNMFAENGLQVAGAVLGAVAGWRKRRFDVSVWLLWWILTALLLIWQIPLRVRYAIMFLPALAALDSLLVAWVLMWLIAWDRGRGIWLGKATAVFLIVVLIGWTMVIPVKSAFASPFTGPSGYIFGYLTEELRDAIDYARISTTANDCVVTDDQRFAMAAGRLVPPTLSETSGARFRTDWMIDAETIISEAESHNCPMTIYKSKNFRRFLPELAPKLRDLYFLEIYYDEEITIFAAEKDVTRQPDITFELRFEDNLELRGIDLTSGPWYPGQRVQLATYWTALAPPSRAYKIFLQLRNDQGQTMANYDHFPFPVPTYRYRFVPTNGGQYRITPNIDNLEDLSADIIVSYPSKGMIPTNAWPVGNMIREVTTMNLRTDLPPGTYHLNIGLYDPDTLDRLSARSDLGETDEFLLATVRIIESN